jgi:hypothetical protein
MRTDFDIHAVPTAARFSLDDLISATVAGTAVPQNNDQPPVTEEGSPQNQTTTTETSAAAAKARKAAAKKAQDYFEKHRTMYVQEIRSQHATAKAKWEKQQTRLDTAREFLHTTVSGALQAAHFGPKQGLRTWYTNLKAVARDEAKIEDDLRERLKRHTEALKHPKHHNIKPADFDRWLSTWETIMDEATLEELVDAKTPGIWFVQFIQAVSNPLGQFAANYDNQYRQTAGALKFRDVSTAFRRAGSILLANNTGRVAKGSFPSFGPQKSGEEAQEEEEQKLPNRSRNNKRKMSTFRSRSEQEKKKPVCRGCGYDTHSTEGCYYLYPHKAPSWWKPRDHIREHVEENLRTDSSLKAETNPLRQKKSKSSLKNRKNGDDEAGQQSN